jgi:hypothetical protein
VQRVTWRTIANDVDEAIRFCGELGLVDLVERSRYTAYRQRLQTLIEAVDGGGAEAARAAFDTDRVLSGIALWECTEFATLLRFMKAQRRTVIRPKLERILDGPLLPTDEDQNSNRGRNILFELDLAAKLWTAGLAPVLGERPDLSCTIDDRLLLIECKRPSSIGGARKAIAKARQQLLRDLKKNRAGSRGVIAVSLTKIANPGDQLFVYQGEATGRSELGAILDGYRRDLEDSCRALPDKIMGMIWHIGTIAVDEQTHLATVVQDTTVHGFIRKSQRDDRELRIMYDRIREFYH